MQVIKGEKQDLQVFEVVKKTAFGRLLKEFGVKAEVNGNEEIQG